MFLIHKTVLNTTSISVMNLYLQIGIWYLNSYYTCSTFYSFFDCLLWHCFVIYLGKASVEAFRQQHPWIKHSYSKIYTKVFNEQKTVRMRGQRRLQDVQDNLAAWILWHALHGPRLFATCGDWLYLSYNTGF